jgi:hypothetical protein
MSGAILPQQLQQAIAKLAKMSPIEYDQNREAAAEQLGIRLATLDDAVKKQRCLTSAKLEEQRDQTEWERLKAGPKEDGAQLLTDIVAFLKRFVYLSEAQCVIVALWVLHTYVLVAAFDFTPYLNVWSASKGCGKSRLLEVLNLIVDRPWYTMRTTASALIRKIATGVTLLLDERDAAFNGNKEYGEALRGILNSGFTRHGKASLSEKDINGNPVPKDIPVFGAKAIGGIGRLIETVADRSFSILMLKKPPHLKVEKFRMSGRIGTEIKASAEVLRKRCERWTAQKLEILRDVDPELPEALDDRGADISFPLLAIADCCLKEWPDKARSAVLELRGAQLADDKPATVELLRDIQAIFNTRGSGSDRISTAALLSSLTASGSRWAKCDYGRPLNDRGLAEMLRGLNIMPRNVRIAGTVLKGYVRDDFTDAFAAYLPNAESRDGVDAATNETRTIDLSEFADNTEDDENVQ